MSGHDEKPSVLLVGERERLACSECGSRTFRRYYTEYGVASIAMPENEDEIVVSVYESVIDSVWSDYWRCAECGERVNKRVDNHLHVAWLENNE